MDFKKMIKNREDKSYFSVSNIGEDDVKSLAEALKGTEITELDLSGSNFGFSGLEYLTQALKDTQIISLYLNSNNITDEGVKYLAESLHDTHIEDLTLSKNKIGIDAAYYLYSMLCNTKMRSLDLDIYFSEDGHPTKYISQSSYRDIKAIEITLNNNKLGIKGGQTLNKYFQKMFQFAALTFELNRQDLEADDAQYLSEAFKDIKISKLNMYPGHIMQHNGIRYLVQAFKGSQIAKLSVCGMEISATHARYIAEFLREVQVLDLNLSCNDIGDEGMKYLAPALENSDIMYINLIQNNIKAEGVRYLSKILQNSKIVEINLNSNSIGTDGARYLAEGLPNSQVADINLNGNGIEYAGYRYLIDVVESTNISFGYFYGNNIEAGLEDGTKLWPYSIPRNTIACKISHVFKELVSLNPISNEFEFIAPKKNTLSPDDIEEYAFLIGTLNDNPNCKVHIFHEMCKKDYDYDLNVMNKINEFIAIIQHKFCKFFDGKLPVFVESFVDFDYVNLVKQFDDMKLCEIVQYLLLHRVLYYVDENQEILHPYIYNVLHKYGMPLYNEQLEPNKRGEIIAYYRSHPEFDGAQEILDLLGSESFKLK